MVIISQCIRRAQRRVVYLKKYMIFTCQYTSVHLGEKEQSHNEDVLLSTGHREEYATEIIKMIGILGN